MTSCLRAVTDVFRMRPRLDDIDILEVSSTALVSVVFANSWTDSEDLGFAQT